MRNVMTEYTVEIRKQVKVSAKGRDGDETVSEAMKIALEKINHCIRIEEDDLSVIGTYEYTE